MKGQIYFQSGRFYIQLYWDGKTHKFWKYLGEPMWHRKTAEKYLSKIRAEIDDGTFVLASHLPNYPLSVKEYSQRWMKLHEGKFATKRTHQFVLNKHIIPYWKDKDMRKINAGQIKEFSLQLPEGMRTPIMSTFKAMIRAAWKNEDISRLPAFPEIKQHKVGPIKSLTVEQQKMLLDVIPEKHRPIFQFLMIYGLRVGEARALQWDCIKDGRVEIRRNFSYSELVDTTKTGTPRSLKLTEEAQTVLKSIKEKSIPFVFTTRGKPYGHTYLHKIWVKACDKIGMKIPIKNGTRHSFGCQKLCLGYPMDVIQRNLGHSKIATTMMYYAQRDGSVLDDCLENRDRVVVEFQNRKSL